ncbi:MAG: hypothetical protein AAF725_19725 [Acidobacteriota bacterium]
MPIKTNPWSEAATREAAVPSRGRLLRAGLLALAALWAAACGTEKPIEERVVLRFDSQGNLDLELRIELDPTDPQSSDPVSERIREAENRFLAGLDDWSPRFARVAEAEEETFRWRKKKGGLILVERTLVGVDPRELSEILADTPVVVSYEEGSDFAELSFFAGAPAGGGAQERQELQRDIARWADRIAALFAEAEGVYRYLDENPKRALVLLAPFILAEDREQVQEPELTPREEALLDAFNAAIDGVLAANFVQPGASRTLVERSRRFYDPFPARFDLEIPEDPSAVEGFVRSGDGWSVPQVSLRSALEALAEDDRWLAPNPLYLLTDGESTPDEESLEFFVELLDPEIREIPDGPQILEALEQNLAPEEIYRLRWPLSREEPAG